MVEVALLFCQHYELVAREEGNVIPFPGKQGMIQGVDGDFLRGGWAVADKCLQGGKVLWVGELFAEDGVFVGAFWFRYIHGIHSL